MKPIDIMKMRKASPAVHTVSIAPDPRTGSSSTSTVTSGNATASVTGGVGPFTYAWTWDDNIDSITALSPTSATTQFRKTGAVSGESYYGTARCTVTDTGNGSVTADDTVSVELTRTV